MGTPAYIDRAIAEVFRLSFSHASATADTTTKLYTVPAGRSLVVTRVWYNNPTGLLQDASNYFDIRITDGTNDAAHWSTLTGAQGTLTADTPVNMVVSANGNQVIAGGEHLTLFLDETGTATLPAGVGVIEGYLLGPN